MTTGHDVRLTWTGGGHEKWDLSTPYTDGIGGSETCAGRLGAIAAANGHEVVLYGEHDPGVQEGVTLEHHSRFRPKKEKFDLFISSRSTHPITDELKARKKLVWIHDHDIDLHDSPWKLDLIDAFVCLSPWHRQPIEGFYAVPRSKTLLIPNGVDVSLF